MKLEKNRKALGRPRKTIDWRMFDKLCYLQCTLDEIADFFECDPDTIGAIVKREQNLTFSEYVKYKRVDGKIDLRGWQMTSARKGNAAMQIWCGKQYLGQKERIEASGPDGAPLGAQYSNDDFAAQRRLSLIEQVRKRREEREQNRLH